MSFHDQNRNRVLKAAISKKGKYIGKKVPKIHNRPIK